MASSETQAHTDVVMTVANHQRAIYLASGSLLLAAVTTVVAIPVDAHEPSLVRAAPIFVGMAVLPSLIGLLGSVLATRWPRVGLWTYAVATMYYLAAWIAFLYLSLFSAPSLLLQLMAAPSMWRQSRQRPTRPPAQQRNDDAGSV